MSSPNLSDAVPAFKESLGSHYDPSQHSDILLGRFLKARNFDVPLATAMFIKWREWYVQERVDDILQTFTFPELPALREIYPRFQHKTDKQGRMVVYNQFGKLDVSKIFQITTPERMLTYEIRESEKLEKYRFPALSKKAGRNVDKVVLVLDVAGFPFMQFYRIQAVLGKIAENNSNYHPETLGQVLIINAPFIFKAIWKLIINIIPAETAAKCNILGSDYQETLLNLIDAENVPKFFGGTCECPGGCERADVGPWNDGTVKGYPDEFWEGFRKRDLDAAAAAAAAAAGISASDEK
ncbi:hypothetical protein CcCBS67573_g07496 [Chytriomyces confervae]|uniref:CRAL-TRIO domain-containing protein n=1 Tax=Chytriomyces confervae TaxID=246404 RepID=A0A507EVR7_9FUNG|nr:hypothetical protein CcCBS67573_g07496 [Chytriomyces confervae]